MSRLFPGIGLAELLALSTSLSYSVTLISLRQGMRSGSPVAAILIINTLVGTTGLAAAFFRGTLQATSLRFIVWFALAGFLGPGLGHLTSYIGIQRMGVSRSSPVTASSPLWVLMLATAFLGERPGAPVWFGTVGIVAGVVLLSLPDKDDALAFSEWFRGALIFPLAASVLFAIAPIFLKLGFAEQNAPMLGMGVAFTAGTMVVLAGRHLFPRGGVVRADRRALGWFLFGAVFNVAASTMMITSIMLGDVSIVLPLSRLTPLWALVLSYFFLRQVERITLRIVIAAILTVAGGILITAFRG
jgi:DME family drug/metabolite transporter